MRNTLFQILALVVMAGMACGQTYELRSDSGKKYGPIEFKDGKRVTIDNRTFTVRKLDTQKNELLKKLEETIMPEINYREAILPDILEHLQTESGKHSKDGKEIVMVLKLDPSDEEEALSTPTEVDPFSSPKSEPSAEPETEGGVNKNRKLRPNEIPITLRAKKVSLLEILKIVTKIARVKYQISDGTVMVVSQNAPDGPIISRTYNVLPCVGERMVVDGQHSGEFIDSDYSGESDWKSFFSDLGVPWPTGSSIKYMPSLGKLVVSNTAENLEILDLILSELDVVPYQIEITIQFVEFSLEDIDALARKGNVDQDSLMTLWEKGKATLLAAPRVVTQAGCEAIVKGTREIRYPEEMTIQNEIIVSNETGFVTNTVTMRQPVMETREVGAIFNVLPEVSPEGQMINLTMTPEYVEEPTWRTYATKYFDGRGGEKIATSEQPFFPVRSLSTSISIYDGETILAGGGVPGKKDDILMYTFVKARLIDPAGKAVKKSDTWEERL